jgi:hypothetical protein
MKVLTKVMQFAGLGCGALAAAMVVSSRIRPAYTFIIIAAVLFWGGRFLENRMTDED